MLGLDPVYLPGDPAAPNIINVQAPYTGGTYYSPNLQAPVAYWKPVLFGGAAIILLLLMLEEA